MTLEIHTVRRVRVAPGRMALIVVSGLVFAFLVFPITIVFPISLTPTGIEFPPSSVSLDGYITFFSSSDWLDAVFLSARVAFFSTLLALPLGIAAAFGLVRSRARLKRYMNTLVFTAATGIKVEYFNTARLGKLKAQVESGQPEMDTTWLNGIEMPAATSGNYVQKLHYDVIDKGELSPNQYGHAFGDYGITFDIFTEAMAYNTKKWPGDDHPRSWADFWDVKKFPGPRAMDGRPPLNGAFEAASRAMGIPAKDVYPVDLDKVYAKLDEIKPHVAIWLKRGSEQVKAMISEEVDMILAFSGRIAEAGRKGAPFKVVPQTYIRTSGSLFVVPAKAKHPRNASLLIGYCARKGPMAKFAGARAGAPSNMMAIDLMDKAMAPSNHPSLASTTVVVSDEWYAPRLPDLNKQWTEWVTR